MGLWSADKKPYASAVVPPAPLWVPSQKPLAPSIISASDKEDEVILEAVHGSPGICLRLRKTSSRR